MRAVVVSGTASSVTGLQGTEAAAKTGTADITASTSNASFAVFAPASSPRVAVVVFLQPTSNRQQLVGGRDAGPIAAAILRAGLNETT